LRVCVPFILVLAGSLTASSQSAPPAPAPDPVPTLKVDVRLVPVHVVVRDAHGRTVGNLAKDDFQLLDQGKPQGITQFSVEHVSPQAAAASASPGRTSAPVAAQARYTAYLFDDLHLQREDMLQARKSADRQLASLSPATERAAIFTTSGQKGIDFTSDQAKLHDILAHLEAQNTSVASDCPHMSYYTADLIANKGDEYALQAATNSAVADCGFFRSSTVVGASQNMVRATAREKAEIGRVETQASLRILKALVQGMSKAPGQRTIIIVSSGFFFAEGPEQVEIMDLAVRGDVIVSALDPRGLAPASDVREATGKFDPQAFAYKSVSDSQEQVVLADLADGTGGVFFHNNNDIDEGFRRVASTPEYSYILAFKPQDMKPDGSFHRLKVTVNNHGKLTVQAREGYYAPKKKP
jgi:VWFA-related protein